MARVGVFFIFLIFLSSCNFFKDIISAALVKRFASSRQVGDLEMMDEDFKKKFPYKQKIFIECLCREEEKLGESDSSGVSFRGNGLRGVYIIHPSVYIEQIWKKGDSVGLYFYYIVWDIDLCQCSKYKEGDVSYWQYYFLHRENLIAFEKDTAMCFNINRDFGRIGYFLRKHQMSWMRRQILLAKFSMLRRGAILSIKELPW